LGNIRSVLKHELYHLYDAKDEVYKEGLIDKLILKLLNSERGQNDEKFRHAIFSADRAWFGIKEKVDYYFNREPKVVLYGSTGIKFD